jgi:hypothetical protein
MRELKVELDEPLFTHGEACAVSGVDSKDLNNWIQRAVIELGTMHRSGRRLYSIIDLIKLRVIGDLLTTVKLLPASAAAIAKLVMPRAAEIAALDDDGELIHRGYHGTETPQFLAAWVEPDKDKFTVVRIAEAKLIEAVRVPHPIILLPLDEIALTVTLKALALLDKERR